jgi:hypothetical protein
MNLYGVQIKNEIAKFQLDEYTYNLVWNAGHEYVALRVLTYHYDFKRRCEVLTDDYGLGFIHTEDDVFVGDFPRYYWEDSINDPHFKEFTVRSDTRFACKGNLCDLMLNIQDRVADDLRRAFEDTKARMLEEKENRRQRRWYNRLKRWLLRQK